jgi:hypothetical protein
MSLFTTILKRTLGDECAQSLKIGTKTDEETRKDGWAAILGVPELVVVFLNGRDLRALGQTNTRVLISIREWTDKCIRWVLVTNYAWSDPPRSLDCNSSSAFHGTMKHIKLLNEMTEKRFFIVGEGGTVVSFSVDKFLESYNNVTDTGSGNKSLFKVYETRFEGLSRCLPQSMLINGSIYVLGGENPKRSTENRTGLEALDPLCLLEPKKRIALLGSIHRKPSTWKSTETSFLSALPEKGLHRFHTTLHDGYIYITGGRYLENTEIRGGARRVNSQRTYRVSVESLEHATAAGFQRTWYCNATNVGADSQELSTEKDDSDSHCVAALPSFQTGRYGHASVVFKNRLIVAGGEKHSQLENSVEYLDLGEWRQYEDKVKAARATGAGRAAVPTPAWHSMPPLAAPGRFAFSLLVINERLYAVGGSDKDSVTVERLDESSDASASCWSVVARLPGTDSDWGAFCVSYEHFIFYFGLYNPLESPRTANPHFNAYDLKKDRWLWSGSDDSVGGGGPGARALLSRLVMGQPTSKASEYSLPTPFSRFSTFVAAVIPER